MWNWPLAEMRIEWRTKWGLGGGHKCHATGALGEAGKSSLVSGGAEMWRNSISYHPALYIANCLFWKARKKNFQLFRALKPQPTSWVGWGTWLGLEILEIYLCYFFWLVLIFGPFWVIFGPFWQFWVIFGPIWAILGHFWAIFWCYFLWQNMPLCYLNHFLQLCTVVLV